MSSDVGTNPQTAAPAESKTARKKKAKVESTAAAVATPEKTTSELGAGSDHAGKANGVDGSSENPYIKELQK